MGRYDDDYDERDFQHSFELTCTGCGTTYNNLDGWCPSCGSSSCSYSDADARQWNEYADREARYGR
jgi:rRNA maturation endonuclease Nob1